MKKLNIYILNDSKNQRNYPLIETQEDSIKIAINVFNLSIYDLKKELKKINSLISISDTYSKIIKRINIIFDKRIDPLNVKSILGKLNDILYSYYPITKEIKLYNIDQSSSNYMSEVIKYKDIVMDPNKTPKTYLEYIKLNTPSNYNIQVFNVKETNDFPLTKAVASGSVHPSYFVHISPKKVDINNKNVFLVGKGITYDSGGLNIKSQNMHYMKIDMIGSAIILSVLKLLNLDKADEKINIHLVIPIAENMIGNQAIKPGSVIKSYGNKLVEISDTDAEGRLCIADAIEYIQLKLLGNLDLSKCILIDTATLTGNTNYITSGLSSLLICNDKGLLFKDELIKIADNIGEYVDFLKMRDEYLDFLKSPVADIANLNHDNKAGCIIGGTFINYFVDKRIPWIHLDLGSCTFIDKKPISYGINLLYQFILQFKK